MGNAPLVAVFLKDSRLYQVQTGWIAVDGLDATKCGLILLNKLPRAPVLLSGVTFGGFNLIDPWKVQKRFRIPTVVVVGSRPNSNSVKRALVKHFPDWKQRWKVLRSLGTLRRVRTMPGEPPLYYEAVGCSTAEARNILKRTSKVSRVPEPIRVAGLIARELFRETSRVSS